MSNITNAQNILNESKEFSTAILKKIQKMTDNNEHGEARILCAKTMKDKKLESAYAGVQAIADYYGHLPSELGKIRYEIDKKMWAKLKSSYSNGNDVYMSF